MILIDPGSALVKLFTAWRQSKQAQAWARLLFSMLFSGLISFLGAAGTALVGGEGLLVSLGYGMVAAAGVLFSLFLASPLTRGMMISVPRQIVERHQEQSDQVTIHRQ
ncbi:MAG: hypothetical protein L0212_04005 [Acidobacteria bacterium]|nr:hypothetical protein [Acidobacteriota bacterium]